MVQRVSRIFQVLPKGYSKSSVHLVVPHMSGVLFAEHTSSGPPSYVRTTDKSVHLVPNVIRLKLRVSGLVKLLL
jgi:hypothetical protein